MIVLASQSPYRKKLLEKTPFDFICQNPAMDEEELKEKFTGSSRQLCMYLAEKKAQSLKSQHPTKIIIGSDQSLLLEDRHLGKSHSYEKAYEQLKSCSGKTAELITSVALVSAEETVSFENVTSLHYRDLKDSEIEWYLNKDQPFDCAGSFKIEEAGAYLFKSISCSDTTAIQGLPIMQLTQEILNLQKKV